MKVKFLTLEEAHKSGRQFRKIGSQEWKVLKDVGHITGEEAFEKIWEIKEKESYSRYEVEHLIRKTIYKLNHSNVSLDSLARTELVMKVMEE